MYLIKVILGFSEEANKRAKGHKRIFILAVCRLLDNEITDIVGAKKINEMLDRDKYSFELIPEETRYFYDISLDRMFSIVRQVFCGNLVNSNANLMISVGTLDKDIFDLFIPREQYINMPDSSLVSTVIEATKKHMGDRYLNANR